MWPWLQEANNISSTDTSEATPALLNAKGLQVLLFYNIESKGIFVTPIRICHVSPAEPVSSNVCCKWQKGTGKKWCSCTTPAILWRICYPARRWQRRNFKMHRNGIKTVEMVKLVIYSYRCILTLISLLCTFQLKLHKRRSQTICIYYTFIHHLYWFIDIRYVNIWSLTFYRRPKFQLMQTVFIFIY